MKGYKIAINIILVVSLILWILLAVLTYFRGMQGVSNSASNAASTGAEDGGVVGGVAAGSFVAIFGALAVFMLIFLYGIPVVFSIIILIIFNVKKSPSIALSVITIITASIPAGIVMLIYRSKLLETKSTENNY